MPGPGRRDRTPARRAARPTCPTVLVNHYPLDRHPTDVLWHPEFAMWCGTGCTADWHRRFRVADHGLRPSAHPPHHLARGRPLRGGVGGLSPRVAQARRPAGAAAPHPAGGGRGAVIEETAAGAGGDRGGVRLRRAAETPCCSPRRRPSWPARSRKRRREFAAVRSCARRAMAEARRAARADPARGARRPAVAGRAGRQHDPLRRVPRRRPGPRRGPGVPRHRRRAPRAAARGRPARRRRCPPSGTGCAGCPRPPRGPLGPAAVQRQGVRLQGVVPPHPAVARLHRRPTSRSASTPASRCMAPSAPNSSSPGRWWAAGASAHFDGRWTVGARTDGDGRHRAARLTYGTTGVRHDGLLRAFRIRGTYGSGGHQVCSSRKNASSLPVSPAWARACSASASTAGGTTDGRPASGGPGATSKAARDRVQQPKIGLDGGALAVGQYGGVHRAALPRSTASVTPRTAARFRCRPTDNPAAARRFARLAEAKPRRNPRREAALR